MRGAAGAGCTRGDTPAQGLAQPTGGSRIRQRRHVTVNMLGFLIGRCRSCNAPVSAFALTCRRCGAANQPNPVATVAAFSALAVIAGAVALGVYAFRARGTTSTSGPPAAS